jgi:isoleucyl-tRNA synthetase
MPIAELPRNLNLPALEEEILQFWQNNHTYESVTDLARGRPVFRFLDGPPYTTGAIHLGTAWNKILKDMVLRYWRMKGFCVVDTPGFDMHGLPIEVKVEKELGVKRKPDIETKIGVDKFVARCKEYALSNLGQMTDQFIRLGVWMNWKRPYRTLDGPYIEGTWYMLKHAYERNYLYRGLQPLSCCPRCETALAKREHEYKTVKDYSIWVKFPLTERKKEFLVIWTTTPWTLPANLGVMANPDYEYVRVRVDDEVWILAKGLANVILQALLSKDYEILEEISGKQLAGLHYRHPLLEEVPHQAELAKQNRKMHTVVLSEEYVTLEQGTGLVHMAPGHGPEDFEVGMREGFPAFCPVTMAGTFSEEAGKYAGMSVKAANEVILGDLKRKGLLVHQGTVEHEYAHCWRCDTPLIFLATNQWFLRVSTLRDAMVKKNEDVRWVPDWAGHTWFRNWLQNLQDWCISRQRYWGAPLPIWTCSRCNHIEVISSIEELCKKAGKVPEDLHRPWIDAVTWPCPKCKGTLTRVKDVLDVWVDSGVAPWASRWATYGTKDFDNWEPADFVVEGKDQISNWFCTLLNATFLVAGREAYKQVFMHGFTSDELGRPMSKSLGNVRPPDDIVKKYGAETYRFYCIKCTGPGEDMRFLWKDVEDTYRSLMILWNVYVFATTFMKAADFDPTKYRPLNAELQSEDRWILSQLNSLVEQVTTRLEKYELPFVPRLIEDFIVRDLSRWYIKLIRERTWVSSEDESKTAAFGVLYQTLRTLLQLTAPILPFLSEKMYQALVRPAEPTAPSSVHMLPWAKADKRLIDEKLSREMQDALDIVEAAQALRQEAGVKLRWPCSRLVVVPGRKDFSLGQVTGIVARQANVVSVEVGPKPRGADLKSKELPFCTVYLDIAKTAELQAERLSRELIRQIQAARKRQGLHVTQQIMLYVAVKSPELSEAIRTTKASIASKVGARALNLVKELPSTGIGATGALTFADQQIRFGFVVAS